MQIIKGKNALSAVKNVCLKPFEIADFYYESVCVCVRARMYI